MATQVTLNSGSVDSAGSLALKTNGTTTAVTINSSQGVEFNAGTAALPSITTTGDTNTGIFFPAADTIAFTEGGVEAMRIDSDGDVGIGTSSPAAKLHIFSANSVSSRVETSGAGSAASQFKSPSGSTFLGQDATGGYLLTDYSAPLLFYINNTERARIDTSGNLLVGTTSSSSGFTLQRSGSDTAEIKINQTGTGGRDYRIGSTGSGYGSAGNLIFYDATASAERARIDSSGNLLVGTTTALGLVTVARSTASSYNYASNAISNQPDHMGFFNGGTNTGSIQRNGGSGVSYVTTSDYRLKENIVPMTGALTKVTKLKPVTYIWKLDGSEGQGFIAHELAEVVPDCVAGDKDAVNEDGSIKPQGIDTSFLVATLTAAIQEQQALITQLTARLDAANL